MDSVVDEGDHAAETCCQSSGLEVIVQEGQQLGRTQLHKLVDPRLLARTTQPFAKRFSSPSGPSSS